MFIVLLRSFTKTAHPSAAAHCAPAVKCFCPPVVKNIGVCVCVCVNRMLHMFLMISNSFFFLINTILYKSDELYPVYFLLYFQRFYEDHFCFKFQTHKSTTCTSKLKLFDFFSSFAFARWVLIFSLTHPSQISEWREDVRLTDKAGDSTVAQTPPSEKQRALKNSGKPSKKCWSGDRKRRVVCTRAAGLLSPLCVPRFPRAHDL